VTSDLSVFDFDALLQASLSHVDTDHDDTEGQDLDYVNLHPDDAFQHPLTPPPPPPSPSPSPSPSLTSSPLPPLPISSGAPLPAVPAESSKKKRTRDRLRRLEKKKLSRQVKRKRDAAARASSSNDVCTRDIAKNHIHSCKAVLTPMELKKVRVTKPGWIGLKDVKGKKGKKIGDDARIPWTLDDLVAKGFKIEEWDGK
jgi:hypothetical protein